jgi:hypothetical protein
LKYKLDQAKNHLEKEEFLEEQRALRAGAWTNQLVVEPIKTTHFEKQLHLQTELNQDEEDLRELNALRARQLEKRAN